MIASRTGAAFVSSLYRSYASCSEHVDKAMMQALHVATPTDDFLARSVLDGKVVVLTGQPGDGKTHMLRMALIGSLQGFEDRVCLDANQMTDEANLAWFRQNVASGRGGSIAINHGILHPILLKADSQGDKWASKALKQFADCYGQGETIETSDQAHHRIVVVDLGKRDNLARGTLNGLIQAICKLILFEPPSKGQAQNNALKLSEPFARERLVDLIEATKYWNPVVAMRDVLGCIAFVLTGGVGTKGSSPAFHHAAFSKGRGEILDALRRLDPIRFPDASLDIQLWRENATKRDEERNNAFLDQKRAVFFDDRSDDFRTRILSEAKRRSASSVLGITREKLVTRLNTFFNRQDRDENDLKLWTSHRYDSAVPRHVFALHQIPEAELEMERPVLCPEIAGAFPGHVAPHVWLCHVPTKLRLKVDSDFLDATSRPGGFGRSSGKDVPMVERSILSFYDSLSGSCKWTARSSMLVQRIRLSDGHVQKVRVQMDDRRYSV